MDLTTLLSSMLSDDSLTAVAQKAGVSEDAAAGVLASALPSLLNGANGQASGKDTSDSFQEAVLAHAGRNPKDVDLDEGKKIVGHLLGTQNTATQQEIADRSGLNSSQVGLILAAAAPMLMNMLGSNSSSNTSAGTASLLTSLLGGGSNSASSNSFMSSALSSVLTGAMGGNSGSNNLLGSLLGSALGGQSNNKPQNNMAGSIIGSLLGGGQSSNSQNNMAGSILGSLLGGGQSNNKPQSNNQSSGLNLGSILSSLLK